MPTKKFQRTKENFTCEQCGFFVAGNGYTNHCPECLWSQHVDIYPGDRSAECGGLMRPVELTIRRGGYVIIQRCVRCDFKRPNKAGLQDSPRALVQLSKDYGEK